MLLNYLVKFVLEKLEGLGSMDSFGSAGVWIFETQSYRFYSFRIVFGAGIEIAHRSFFADVPLMIKMFFRGEIIFLI